MGGGSCGSGSDSMPSSWEVELEGRRWASRRRRLAEEDTAARDDDGLELLGRGGCGFCGGAFLTTNLVAPVPNAGADRGGREEDAWGGGLQQQ